MAKSIRVEPASSIYRRLMPFNRYSFERFDGFVVMHFGLVSPAGSLLDHYSCGSTQVELENLKKSLMEYLGKAGSLGEAPPEWHPPMGLKQVDVCNFIGVCGSPQIAETTLNNMVGKELADMKPSQNVLKADTIALLRSPLEVQKHWIKDLFK
jgi:hypothetical protein